MTYDPPFPYEPRAFEIAGVDLYGERQDDGTILIGSSNHGPATPLPDFPSEIKVAGAVYTLENIRKNRLEFGIKDPNHPGYNIEWGVYV